MDHLKVRTQPILFYLVEQVDVSVPKFLPLAFQQLMASRSDALFRDAKSKLLEIRAQHSKRLEARSETREEKRRKKKNKKSE